MSSPRHFGSGVNSWLIHFERGECCISAAPYLNHKRTQLSSSKKMAKQIACSEILSNIPKCNPGFRLPRIYISAAPYLDHKRTQLSSSKKVAKQIACSEILSNIPKCNPDFYNWNKVKVRYYHESSFTDDVEKVDPIANQTTLQRCKDMASCYVEPACQTNKQRRKCMRPYKHSASQVEEEISCLSAELEAKHAEELALLGYKSSGDSDKGSLDNLVKAIAGVSVANNSDFAKHCKGALRRGKRAQEEAAREQRIHPMPKGAHCDILRLLPGRGTGYPITDMLMAAANITTRLSPWIYLDGTMGVKWLPYDNTLKSCF